MSNYLLSFACIIVLAILSLANSGGRASTSNQGNTGAPGDEALANGDARTCQSCHATGDIQVSMLLEVLDADGASIAAYTPNEIYTARVTISSEAGPTPNGYGFQMVSLFNSDNNDVNGWLSEGHSDNVQIAGSTRTNRVYAEHRGVRNSNEFLVQWQAPEAGSGDLTFYAAGIGANANANRTGDGAVIPQTLTLAESTTSSISSLEKAGIELSVAPNPAKDILFINIGSPLSGKLNLRIFDTFGRLIVNEKQQLFEGNQIKRLSINHLHEGIYWLQIIHEGKSATRKVFVNH